MILDATPVPSRRAHAVGPPPATVETIPPGKYDGVAAADGELEPLDAGLGEVVAAPDDVTVGLGVADDTLEADAVSTLDEDGAPVAVRVAAVAVATPDGEPDDDGVVLDVDVEEAVDVAEDDAVDVAVGVEVDVAQDDAVNEAVGVAAAEAVDAALPEDVGVAVEDAELDALLVGLAVAVAEAELVAVAVGRWYRVTLAPGCATESSVALSVDVEMAAAKEATLAAGSTVEKEAEKGRTGEAHGAAAAGQVVAFVLSGSAAAT